MTNYKDIATSFINSKLVTFNNPSNNNGVIVDSLLSGASKSGRYFNTGTSSLLRNLSNLESVAPYFTDYTYDTYDSLETYSIDKVVTDGTDIYQSLVNSNLGNNLNDTNFWRLTDSFSLWLKEQILSSTEIVLSEVLTPNPIITNDSIYKKGSVLNDLVPNNGKLVGYIFKLLNSEYLQATIDNIGLQFKGTASEEVTFYLYNQNELIQTFAITPTNIDGGLVWYDISSNPIIIDGSKAGNWYLCYNQTDLTTIDAVGENTIFPQAYYYDGLSDYQLDNAFDVLPFETEIGSNLNEIDDNNFRYTTTFGLNFRITIESNLNYFAKTNINAFAKCVQLQSAYTFLENALGNVNARSNRLERNQTVFFDEKMLSYELKSYEGDTLVLKLKKAYKELKSSIENLAKFDIALQEYYDDNYDITSV